ncbi:oxidoreductase alpha (molybdopterin) subunit [Sinomicrobium oceani]|uniref:Oxidoreductase alpha (Molybdopterin) subunit n=1 Tax=Sinomicrobium oceani TaxID=1150368 RepID=A0A1K1LND1_9FLAO|nr:FdhF/YdeP family oxidoreductase [Sinomicrobium oceani]SFW12363.1 oxidoreductase alpha (molybdopterin) subunit [Sinomicrobium oceani]
MMKTDKKEASGSEDNGASVHAENPETLNNLKVNTPKEVAAGFPAVVSAMKHVFGEMGPGRGMKALLNLNQKGGIDCPSCAWPDPDGHRSAIAEYCENGAKAIADEATTKVLHAGFFAKHSIAALSGLDDFHIGKKGRLGEPVYRRENATHYEPVSWEEAFRIIARHLQSLDSPDEATFYTSGRTSNEAAFLYQLFAREYGTNNLPDCSNMCHESSGVALGESLGIGKGSVTLEDLYRAEVIIIAGQNPGTNHPRMLSALEKAKRNGCIIIAVNPLPETGLIAFDNPQEVKGMLGMGKKLSDVFLQVKINGDLPLMKALMKLMLEQERQHPGTVFDHDFIREHTSEYDEFIESLDKHSLEELSEACGIGLEQLREVAGILCKKNNIITCWAMGLTQHKNSVDTIKEFVNLLLLKGSIGKPGAGTCPVRGHSNVQGDRTMGIFEQPSQELLDSIARNFGFHPPQHHGFDVVNSIKAMHDGRVKVFMGMGGNFLSATPDTLYTAQALQQCRLTVQVSTKLNRSHLITGKEALILPTFGRSDIHEVGGEKQFVSCENSMGVVQMSQGRLQPVSTHLRSETAIICHLAKAVLGNRSKVNWDRFLDHNDHIRDAIEATIPGFEQYNKRVREPGGFYLPNSAREKRFPTDTLKARFHVSDVEMVHLEDDELLMMTIRSHDQFNTTVYGLEDRYRGIHNERRIILMNTKDIEKLGYRDRDVVDLYNDQGGTARVARKFVIIAYNIPEKCCATYFPEANVLVPIGTVADQSNTPASKSVVLRIKKHGDVPKKSTAAG